MPAAAAASASPPALPFFELGAAFFAAATGTTELMTFLIALCCGLRRRSAVVGMVRRGVDDPRAKRPRPVAGVLVRPKRVVVALLVLAAPFVCVAISASGRSTSA